jgi:signal transduction histidine kinase
MAALLFFGLALYFIALWIAKKTIEPIRKSEEYARSYNHHIAHELKTPLAIIRSDLELALKSPQDVSSYIGSAVEEV